MKPRILIILSPLTREGAQCQNDQAIYRWMMDRNLEVSSKERKGIPKVIEKLIEIFHSYHPLV